VVIAVLGIVGFIAWNLISLMPLLVVSALLSYLLYPVVNFIEDRLLIILPFRARSLAVLLTFMSVIAGFVIIVIVIAPALINQITDIGDDLPRILEATEDELRDILNRPLTINGRPVLIDGEPLIPLEGIQEITGGDVTDTSGASSDGSFNFAQAFRGFFGSVGDLTGPAFSVLGGAVTAVVNATFVLVIMFYLMRDGDQFTAKLVNLTPSSYQGDVRRLLYELGRVWNAYFRGQLILSVSVGMAVYLAALILGLSNAPILGLLAGLLEFIPNLGPFIASVPAVLIALVSESGTFPFLSGLPFALVVILVWTGIQNLEAIFLVPRVMGGSLNLHPVVVILGVITGASVAGALGIILAAPFIATIRVAGQYLYGKIFDTNPFPQSSRNAPLQRNMAFRYYMVAQRYVRRMPTLSSNSRPVQTTLAASDGISGVTAVTPSDEETNS
jgi:predicted PurR-regulated permease PerM